MAGGIVSNYPKGYFDLNTGRILACSPDIKNELLKLKVEPSYIEGFLKSKENKDLPEQYKSLHKVLETVKIQNVIGDKDKNIIKDKKIGSFTLRNQILIDFPPKQLNKILDQGKKDIKKGIIVAFASDDEEGKIGVAIGITKDLTDKHNAVELVKVASKIIGGKGGGGRKDFAQAGGQDKSKIDKALEKIKSLV